MKKVIYYLFLFLMIILNNPGCKSPTGPPAEIQSTVPQWGMFRHDARHTGNVNTPVEGITGPSGDSVAVKWRIPIDGDLIGSPAIGSDGTIYIGTDNILKNDSCSVYAINPDGSIRWRYTPIHRMWSSPAIGNDGSIYIGTLVDGGNGGGIYALSSTGQLKWIHDPGEDIISSPAVGKDGTIYYTDKDYLVALNPNDGSTKWQVNGGDYFCSPAVSSKGTIYYSSYGTIRAVNTDGIIQWTYVDSSYARQHVFGIEIGNDGTLYFVSSDSPFLYALKNNGELKWKYRIGNYGVDPALDTKGNVYAAAVTSKLVAVDSTGIIKWEAPLTNTSGNLKCPIVVDNKGVIYVGASGFITQPSLFAYHMGNLVWSFGTNYPFNDGGITASPAIYNGSLYFAWDSGPHFYFYCLQ